MSEEIRYQRGRASASELQALIEAFWAELATDEDLRREVTEAGADLADVERIDPARDITVTQEGEGLDPLTVTIVVALAPSAVHIVNSLWDEVVISWIRRRREGGADVVGKKKSKKSKKNKP